MVCQRFKLNLGIQQRTWAQEIFTRRKSGEGKKLGKLTWYTVDW